MGDACAASPPKANPRATPMRDTGSFAKSRRDTLGSIRLHRSNRGHLAAQASVSIPGIGKVLAANLRKPLAGTFRNAESAQ